MSDEFSQTATPSPLWERVGVRGTRGLIQPHPFFFSQHIASILLPSMSRTKAA
jgi:hypothetical protein